MNRGNALLPSQIGNCTGHFNQLKVRPGGQIPFFDSQPQNSFRFSGQRTVFPHLPIFHLGIDKNPITLKSPLLNFSGRDYFLSYIATPIITPPSPSYLLASGSSLLHHRGTRGRVTSLFHFHRPYLNMQLNPV